MGVINITPNSFSDGGELLSLEKMTQRISSFGKVDVFDIGAESTAPMNEPIDHEEEWIRLRPYLPLLKSLGLPISFDTYHVETIGRVSKMWMTEKISTSLIWNDVSGKFDNAVKDFLKMNKNFYYIYCHNLAPIRELTSRHQDYLSPTQGEAFLDELAHYFTPYLNPQVIFDPALGFSKSYEQNWHILNNFSDLQRKCGHDRWLLGFSRKSFLRKKLGIEKMTPESKEVLDQYHHDLLTQMKPSLTDEIFIRTHRPELIKDEFTL